MENTKRYEESSPAKLTGPSERGTAGREGHATPGWVGGYASEGTRDVGLGVQFAPRSPVPSWASAVRGEQCSSQMGMSAVAAG